jgi:serine/threonine protein phosphatase PrpC
MARAATEAGEASVPELVLDAHMEAPRTGLLAGGAAAVFSARSPDKETSNEDAALLLELDGRRAVLAVADGVGGLPEGQRASKAALEALRKAVQGLAVDGSLREAILDGFERANAAVLGLRNGAATTLVVAELDGATVRSYHAGDSGLMVVGGRGAIQVQTVDHAPVAYAVEAGLLDEREAIQHADRHLISNVLGREDMRVEIGPTLELRPRDTLLLASDGLFDNLRTTEIAERARRRGVEAAAALLAADCRKRMEAPREGRPSKPDDLTLVLFRLRPRRRRQREDGAGRSSSA